MVLQWGIISDMEILEIFYAMMHIKTRVHLLVFSEQTKFMAICPALALSSVDWAMICLKSMCILCVQLSCVQGLSQIASYLVHDKNTATLLRRNDTTIDLL